VPPSPRPREAAAYLHQLGILAQLRGDHPEAEALYRRSLAINKEMGNRADLAKVTGQMSALLTETGRPQDAVPPNLESLSAHLELHSADARKNLLLLSRQRGLLGEARFRELVSQHLDAASTDALLDLLNRDEPSPANS
jgi:tetratricopeptide (TPR) repeat protein